MRRPDLCLFGATALASGWVGVGVNRLARQPDSMESPGTLVWLLTPPATALALRRRRYGRFLLGRAGTSPRAGSVAWTTAATAYPVMTAASVLVGRATGLADTRDVDLRGIGSTMAAAVLPALVKNLAEEVSWRGFLTEELLQEGTGRIPLTLVVGLVWGAWHAPYYLFFLPEEQMRQVLDVDRGTFAVVACGVTVCWTVLFTEVYALTRSVWPAAVMHAVEDAVANPPVIDGGVRFTPAGQRLLSPVLGAVTACAHAGLGLLVRRLGRGRAAG